MIARKIFIIGCLAIVGLLYPMSVEAQGVWPVERTHSEIAIDEDGHVQVTETIRVNYGENEVSGFDREFPLKYTIGQKVSFASVEIESVQRNDVDEPYMFHPGNEKATVSIGDERLALSGVQEYTLTYQVAGVLHHRDETDLLYWKTVGGWDHEMQQATATVTLPKDGLRHQYCEIYNFRGQLVEEACESVGLDANTSRYVSSDNIEAGGSMLIAAEFEQNLVPISTVTPPTFTDWLEVYKQPLLLLSGISAACLLLAGGLWLKGRRRPEPVTSDQ